MLDETLKTLKVHYPYCMKCKFSSASTKYIPRTRLVQIPPEYMEIITLYGAKIMWKIPTEHGKLKLNTYTVI